MNDITTGCWDSPVHRKRKPLETGLQLRPPLPPRLHRLITSCFSIMACAKPPKPKSISEPRDFRQPLVINAWAVQAELEKLLKTNVGDAIIVTKFHSLDQELVPPVLEAFTLQ